MADFHFLQRAGLLVGNWDDWRLMRRVSKEKEMRFGEHIPAMLKPDDPGVLDTGNHRPQIPPIPMHIGEWHRDEYGNRWREIMSQETYNER